MPLGLDWLFPFPCWGNFQLQSLMLMISLYAEQKKRHRFIEQSFRLCGRRRGWDVSSGHILLNIIEINVRIL